MIVASKEVIAKLPNIQKPIELISRDLSGVMHLLLGPVQRRISSSPHQLSSEVNVMSLMFAKKLGL